MGQAWQHCHKPAVQSAKGGNDSHSSNWDQTHTKGSKERFLIGQNKTKCVNFRGNPLCQSDVPHKNKQSINSLIFCHLDAWVLAEGFIWIYVCHLSCVIYQTVTLHFMGASE